MSPLAKPLPDDSCEPDTEDCCAAGAGCEMGIARAADLRVVIAVGGEEDAASFVSFKPATS